MLAEGDGPEGVVVSLRLWVDCRFVANGCELEYRLLSDPPDLVRTFPPVMIPRDPFDYFRGHLLDVQKLCEESGRRPAVVANRLNAKGAALARELFPETLRSALAEEVGRVKTLQVISNEPWIPWELVAVGEAPDDPREAGPFLAEAFVMVRWLPNQLTVPRLPLRRMAVVVARQSGLPNAGKELRLLLGRAGDGRQVEEVKARYEAVREGLRQGEHDAWHFTCHGSAMDRSPRSWPLALDEGDDLKPDDLLEAAEAIRRNRPLVFLNACETGQGAVELTRIGGWAHRFLELGAGAFLGPLWSIEDRRGLAFARAFYDRFLSGVPLGEAVHGARLELKAENPSDPHRLAYVVYGDPDARCLPSQGASAPAAVEPPPPMEAEEPPPAEKPSRRDPAPRAASPPVAEDSRTARVSAAASPSSPAPGAEHVHEADGSVLVYVPAGQYSLGAENLDEWARPVHWVELSAFWISRFPVTNEQYRRFLEANPERPEPPFWHLEVFADPRQPVVGVTWEDAMSYCRWAGLRLPTEAQWEAAARGPDCRPYPWGKETPTPDRANFGGDRGRPTPVDAFPAGRGPFGTQDQAGNVWEWCVDGFSRTAYRERGDGARDPMAAAGHGTCVVRGGSWQDPPSELHSAHRQYGTATITFNNQGFRCVAVDGS